MKKILIVFAVISTFASCSDQKKDSETTKDVVGVTDSSIYKNNTAADTAKTVVPAPTTLPATSATETRVETSKSTRSRITPKHSTSTSAANSSSATVAPAPQTQSTTTSTTAATNTTPATSTTTTTTTPAAPAKKGWSSAAKDATIGGVGGALGGAIISKKKGAGAIIGGALGAAGGYILGRKKDKKQDTAQ